MRWRSRSGPPVWLPGAGKWLATTAGVVAVTLIMLLSPLKVVAGGGDPYESLKPLPPTITSGDKSVRGVIRGYCASSTARGFAETGAYASCASGDPPSYSPRPRLILSREPVLTVEFRDNPNIHDRPARVNVQFVRLRDQERRSLTIGRIFKLRSLRERLWHVRIHRRVPGRANGVKFRVRFRSGGGSHPGEMHFFAGLRDLPKA